ncbi:MAG: DoxX family protein [Gemmatimonadaceae bacterium]
MESSTHMVSSSKGRIWAGRIVSALPVLFLLFDGTIHIMRIPAVVEGFAKAGFPISTAVPLGIIEIVCIILYVIPRTSVLGAILLMGYLGGAVATNVRQQLPMLGYVLFPVYVGVFIWGGLWLRDKRVRDLIPLSKG